MEIILYQAKAKKNSKIIKKALAFSGYNLIVLTLLSLIISFGPIFAQEISYRTRQIFRTKSQTPSSNQLPLSSSLPTQVVEEASRYGVGADFSIVIPKINAAAKVIPNVSPTNEKEYKNALKLGVAHASGSKFPGGKGTIYLFAHSANTPADIARYNAVFYLLKELRSGDEIIIFFAGQKHLYLVADRIVANANETKWLTDNKDNSELLVLQTCWPPGTIQKRLIVTAKPAD